MVCIAICMLLISPNPIQIQILEYSIRNTGVSGEVCHGEVVVQIVDL